MRLLKPSAGPLLMRWWTRKTDAQEMLLVELGQHVHFSIQVNCVAPTADISGPDAFILGILTHFQFQFQFQATDLSPLDQCGAMQRTINHISGTIAINKIIVSIISDCTTPSKSPMTISSAKPPATTMEPPASSSSTESTPNQPAAYGQPPTTNTQRTADARVKPSRKALTEGRLSECIDTVKLLTGLTGKAHRMRLDRTIKNPFNDLENLHGWFGRT